MIVYIHIIVAICSGPLFWKNAHLARFLTILIIILMTCVNVDQKVIASWELKGVR